MVELGYTLTDPFSTLSAPWNSHIVSRMEPRRSGSGKTISLRRERPISSSLRYFPPPRPTFRDLTRAKDKTPSWGRLLYTLARSASSLKLKQNGPLRSLRLLDGRRAIYALAIMKTGTTNYENCYVTILMMIIIMWWRKKRKEASLFSRVYQPLVSANFYAIFCGNWSFLRSSAGWRPWRMLRRNHRDGSCVKEKRDHWFLFIYLFLWLYIATTHPLQLISFSTAVFFYLKFITNNML